MRHARLTQAHHKRLEEQDRCQFEDGLIDSDERNASIAAFHFETSRHTLLTLQTEITLVFLVWRACKVFFGKFKVCVATLMHG